MKIPTWPSPTKMNKSVLGLERVQKLLDLLGNPEDKIPPVFHVAGTNGKGSTTAFLKYILEEAGYRVHRCTSPHLVRFNERIEIAGREIEDAYYYELAEECKSVIRKNKLYVTYFEIITAITFMAFARNEADATILEVGMGGRLDATNVIKNPLVSIITPLSLDHVAVLGNTVEKIAMEKFGIVKKNHPVVISKQRDSVRDLLIEESKKLGSRTFTYGKDWNCTLRADGFNFEYSEANEIKSMPMPSPTLEGAHQPINAATAMAALVLQDRFKITEANYANGIKKTFWKARLQNITNSNLRKYLESDEELYLDGAHNEAGAEVLTSWIETKNREQSRTNVLIICMLTSKAIEDCVKILAPHFSKIVVVSSKNSDKEFLDRDSFIKLFEKHGFSVDGACTNIIDALKLIHSIKTPFAKRILVCGSLYFCGEVLELVEGCGGEK